MTAAVFVINTQPTHASRTRMLRRHLTLILVNVLRASLLVGALESRDTEGSVKGRAVYSGTDNRDNNSAAEPRTTS